MAKTPKLFKCTECDREVDHVTTRLDKAGLKFLEPNEALCDRCVGTRKEQVLDMIKNFDPEDLFDE